MATKTLIQIIQQVAGEFNLPQPTVIISSQDQNVLKLLAFARAVNDDLLAEYDWQVLQTRYSFNTVANQEAYTFPTDIDRWLNATFFNSTSRWPLQGPLTPSEYEWTLINYATGTPFSRYRIFGNYFHVQPTPTTSTTTFTFEYISNYTVLNANTQAPQLDYTQDGDFCRFDHRMVVYGIKLKWLESIGQDTTAALSDYRRAVEQQKGADKPGRVLNAGGYVGYPYLTTANYADGGFTF